LLFENRYNLPNAKGLHILDPLFSVPTLCRISCWTNSIYK